MTEKQLNKRLEDLQVAFEKRLPTYRRRVKQAFDLARIRVSDIIGKYEKNGKVPKNRINALSQELNAVENALYRDLLSQTTIIIEDSATEAAEGVNGALVAGIGVAALIALNGEEDGTEAGFLLGVGMALLLLVKNTLSTVLGRKGNDGLNLRDRLRKLAADIITEARKTLRKSIQTGEDYATLQRYVTDIFANESWRVNRIVDTEALVAYRTSVAKAAEQSDLVAALKIIDFPHGRPGEHEKHKCYEYARADEHGLGKGVYPVTTRKIRNPHPQCTSRLVLVMKEGVLNA